MTSKENSFVCHITDCCRSFKHKEHLKRHQATHEGIRLHQCPTCSRAFTRSDTLNRHMLVHSNAPGRSKRISIACQTCRTRKTKCDAEEPCSACCNLGVPCVRERSSSQNKPHNVTNTNLFNSIYEGPMGPVAQAVRCARSDKTSLVPVGYPLELDNVANIALPGDLGGEFDFGCIPPTDVNFQFPFPVFDMSFDCQGIYQVNDGCRLI